MPMSGSGGHMGTGFIPRPTHERARQKSARKWEPAVLSSAYARTLPLWIGCSSTVSVPSSHLDES